MEFDEEEFKRDRDEVFRALDVERFKAYCRKYEVPILDDDDNVALAAMHKGRLSDVIPLSDEEKELSRRWLQEHGFMPLGPGELDRG